MLLLRAPFPGRAAAPLTSFSDAEDFTEDEGELDAAPGERTLVLVFPAAVLQDELGGGTVGQERRW